MHEIFVASTVLTGLVLALVLIVLAARTLLLDGGVARVTINGGQAVEGEPGETLLDLLDDAGVMLPTSCGGKGTCGLCRVQVAGAAESDSVRPVERVALTESDIAQGFRLACQLVVSGDLDVTVAPELLGKQNWQCTVLASRFLSPLIKEITLALPEGQQQDFPAGCYVIVAAPPFEPNFDTIQLDPEYENNWQRMGLKDLHVVSSMEQRRAYSLVNRPDETNRLVLNIRLALPPMSAPTAPPGVVSSYLFGLKRGDTVLVSGHYGDFFIQDTDREIVLIGGGVGMAPLYAHVYDQLARVHTDRTISFWYGARSQKDLYYADQMEQLANDHANFSWHVALSDPEPGEGWEGAKGFVHSS